MRNRTLGARAAVGTVAALLCVAATPAPGAAQIGAIGAVPGAAGADGSFAGSPIFTESATMLPRGRLSAGAHIAAVSQAMMLEGTEVEVTVSQVLAGVSYAPVEGLMLGFRASPYIAFEASSQFGSVDQSGHGDAFFDARYRLWRAPGGQTQLAANGSVQIPLGDEFFGAEGAALGLGAAISHQLDRLGLHGALGASVPLDEADGQTAMNFSAAGVFGVTERIWLNLEMIGVASDGEHIVNLAPGARIGLGQRAFLDIGVLVNASSSVGAPFDSAALLGISIVP